MGTIIGINGSPRKKGNSAALLNAALQGAAANGQNTRLVHLCDLRFSGCKSCFACKRLSGNSLGRCAVKDDLQALLQEIVQDEEVEGIILSMPIYFGDVPGAVRSFLERLWFPGLLYDKDGKIAYEKSIRVGLIYTMNAADGSYYQGLIQSHQNTFRWLLRAGECPTLLATDTLQFDDYSKFSSSMFDGQQKKHRHDTVFPKLLNQAYELGQKISCLGSSE